jgi:hypothetical protein
MAHIFLEMTSKIKFNIKNYVEDGVKIVTTQKEREIKELSRAKESQLSSLKEMQVLLKEKEDIIAKLKEKVEQI